VEAIISLHDDVDHEPVACKPELASTPFQILIAPLFIGWMTEESSVGGVPSRDDAYCPVPDAAISR
jgi:hypothetical protein